MNIEYVNDKYQVWCGIINRLEINQRAQWCTESWGDNWGFVHTKFGNSCFVFYRHNHAMWFKLKYS